jgi:hypothetical protein
VPDKTASGFVPNRIGHDSKGEHSRDPGDDVEDA